ncbi:MAG: uroporphyrinogen-III synthase [Microthrixaceae bacterium]|nr:uroporphyrinogen-III synthase [Microthrixaceae bacterium]
MPSETEPSPRDDAGAVMPDQPGVAALAGRSVVVTRARDQAADLVRRLEDLGAEVVIAPAIEIVDPSDAGAALEAAVCSVSAAGGPPRGGGTGPPDWLVFTSGNAVRRFCARLQGETDLGAVRVAVIGSATAAAAADAGLEVELMPGRFVAEDLLEVFPDAPVGGGRVLLPRAEAGRDVLPDGLRRKGWTVEVVAAYRTVAAVADDSVRDAVARADAVCFASSSAVSAFVDTYGTETSSAVAAIGPVTAQRAQEVGLTVTIQPEEHTVAAMVVAIARHFDARSVSRGTP